MTADGKVGDITLQWMSQEPGGEGLDRLVRSDATVYMGVNPGSGGPELSTLRAGGGEVAGASGRAAQDTAVVGRNTVDLTTPEGLDAFAASFDRVPEATRTALRAFIESSATGSRDELAQFVRFFYEAEIGTRLIRRVVLSGHSGGFSISGEDSNATSISFSHLRTLRTLFPRAVGQVEDLMLSACNTGQTGKLPQYTAIFPNLRSIWAYVGYSPLGSTPGAGSNRHIAQWARATRGPMDREDLDAARERIAAGGRGPTGTWPSGRATAPVRPHSTRPRVPRPGSTSRRCAARSMAR